MRRESGTEPAHGHRERWLLLRYHSLGDVILSTGIARAASIRVDLEVAVDARFHAVYHGNPYVRRIWDRRELEEAAGERFHRVLDLQGTPGSRALGARLSGRVTTIRPRSLARRWVVLWGERFPQPRVPHVLERYGETLDRSIPREDLGPCLWVTAEEAERAGREIPEILEVPPGLAVAVLPGASRRSKEYPAERFAHLCRGLVRRGVPVWWMAPPESPDPPRGLDPAVRVLRLDLALLKAACSRAGAAVGSDSGPLHLARGLGLPAAAVFGSSVRAFGFAPVGDDCRVIQAEGLACRPCGVHGRNRCWLGHWRCLNDIDPDVVLRAVLELLEPRPGPGVGQDERRHKEAPS